MADMDVDADAPVKGKREGKEKGGNKARFEVKKVRFYFTLESMRQNIDRI